MKAISKLKKRPLRCGLILSTFIVLNGAACDFNMDDKHRCRTDKDCENERQCEGGDDSSLGFCVKRCGGLTDCKSDEFCSLTELDENIVTICISEDACVEDIDCPIGEFGSACLRDVLPGRPSGCLKQACHSTANCPDTWVCLDDPYYTQLPGACSHGDLGHPCIDDDNCTDPLVCDPFESVCTDAGSK